MTESDIIDRCRKTLVDYQQGPLANYVPYCSLTEPTFQRLAALLPRRLATMHGSVYVGDGRNALLDLTTVWREVLSSPL